MGACYLMGGPLVHGTMGYSLRFRIRPFEIYLSGHLHSLLNVTWLAAIVHCPKKMRGICCNRLFPLVFIVVTDDVTSLDFTVFDPDEKMRILFPVMFERSLYAYGVQMNKGYVFDCECFVFCKWDEDTIWGVARIIVRNSTGFVFRGKLSFPESKMFTGLHSSHVWVSLWLSGHNCHFLS